MAIYAGFLRNNKTQEDFVAPVEASDEATAKALLTQRYAEPAYTYLTCYQTGELAQILDGIRRWPGVPSKVQDDAHAPVEHVKASLGKLPPLVREQAGHDKVQPATLAEISAISRLMDEQRRLREERLAKVLGKMPAMQAADKQAEAKAEKNSVVEKAAAPRAEAKAAATTAAPPAGQRSVLDVLKAMRG